MNILWFVGTVIQKFLTNMCVDGIRKVHEMESRLFQDDFIPERLHKAGDGATASSVGMDHGYSMNDAQLNNGYNLPEQTAHIDGQTSDLAVPSANLDHSENTQMLRSQLYYGLLDLEKTLLQALSTIACDGSPMLDALVYFVVIPVSGMYFVR